MLNVSNEKIHPLYKINLDHAELELEKNFITKRIPFLFIEKNGQLEGYVESVDLNGDYSKGALEEHMVSLDMSGVLENIDSISLPFIFQTLGDPITLVKENGEFTGYIRREDLLVELLKEEGTITNLLKIMLASIPMGIFIINTEYKIINSNEAGLRMIKQTADNVMYKDARVIFSRKKLEQVFASKKAMLNQILVTDELGVLFDYSPLMDANGDIEGMMVIVQDLPKVEEMAMEIQYVKNLNADLNAILASLYDEMIVVDHQGTILRFSDNLISVAAKEGKHELIGKSIFELNHEIGALITKMVIEQKEQASIVQQTRTGKNVMASGNPVFDAEGELHRIVIASRDITETTKLRDELDATKQLTKEYKKQLDTLKNKEEFGKKVIYSSLKMEKVMLKVEKLMEFHSTVLLLGESGVGKDLIASVIHQYGKRKDKPYLALNCGAIPEELLESGVIRLCEGAFQVLIWKGKWAILKKRIKVYCF